MNFSFDNSYQSQLGDFYAACTPEPCSTPELVYFNKSLARQLNLMLDDDNHEAAVAGIFSGNTLPDGAQPIAQAYAGHQFGHFSPQLGDGRALIIGEVFDSNNNRTDICLKGSGRTPFSRGGDGKAALGPMLREVLISEFMHACGIPTTRSLAVVATGDPVYRETALPGAVLARTAASHIRVGTFEFFAARQQFDKVRQLADYSIKRHFPEIAALVSGDDPGDSYLRLLQAVIKRQASLIAKWMGVGFIHGVMNTDNMTIAGETIDYGPCAFIDAYNPDAVFSSIDHHGRYAYRNQPFIAKWNLARFAECLVPLLCEQANIPAETAIEEATEAVEAFDEHYHNEWLTVFGNKLGVGSGSELDARKSNSFDVEESKLAEDYLELLRANGVDFTLGFRYLADYLEGKPDRLTVLFGRAEQVQAGNPELESWLKRWISTLENTTNTSIDKTAETLRRHNPLVIPRNHHVEEALQAASESGDFSLFNSLLAALQRPYEPPVSNAKLIEPATAKFTGEYKTFCGT